MRAVRFLKMVPTESDCAPSIERWAKNSGAREWFADLADTLVGAGAGARCGASPMYETGTSGPMLRRWRIFRFFLLLLLLLFFLLFSPRSHSLCLHHLLILLRQLFRISSPNVHFSPYSHPHVQCVLQYWPVSIGYFNRFDSDRTRQA